MTLNIKNQDVEKLLNEVIQITGETKTEAVRKSLEERRQKLVMRFILAKGTTRLLAFLQDEVWPQVPVELMGIRLTKAEEEAMLGYGEEGV